METIEPCAMDELGQSTSALLAAFSTPFAAIWGCAAPRATRTIAKIDTPAIVLIFPVPTLGLVQLPPLRTLLVETPVEDCATDESQATQTNCTGLLRPGMRRWQTVMPSSAPALISPTRLPLAAASLS